MNNRAILFLGVFFSLLASINAVAQAEFGAVKINLSGMAIGRAEINFEKTINEVFSAELNIGASGGRIANDDIPNIFD